MKRSYVVPILKVKMVRKLENVFVKHYDPNYQYLLSLKHALTVILKQQNRPKLFFLFFLENSVDPDEMVHNELSHQALHCLPFCSDF